MTDAATEVAGVIDVVVAETDAIVSAALADADAAIIRAEAQADAIVIVADARADAANIRTETAEVIEEVERSWMKTELTELRGLVTTLVTQVASLIPQASTPAEVVIVEATPEPIVGTDVVENVDANREPEPTQKPKRHRLM